jgi:hypothetical protein
MVACNLRPRGGEFSARMRGAGLLTDGVNDWQWIGSVCASERPYSTLGRE